MKIENIRTDSEGLLKIIEFLHSDRNMQSLSKKGTPEEQIMYNPVFFLTAARSDVTLDPTHQRCPLVVNYIISVDISAQREYPPPQSIVDALCGLVKEVYKA